MTRSAAEADRRIANSILIGTVMSMAGGRARVRSGALEIPNVAIGQLRAGAVSFSWMPAEGEQVLVLSPGGDLAQAVAICGIFAGIPPATDPSAPRMDLGGGTLTIDGDVEVTGDVVASGISLVTHTHSGVQSGPSNTGGPQ